METDRSPPVGAESDSVLQRAEHVETDVRDSRGQDGAGSQQVPMTNSAHSLALVMLIVAPILVRAEQPATATTTATYTNPVARRVPDPFVIHHEQTYYAYGTNAPGEGYRVL